MKNFFLVVIACVLILACTKTDGSSGTDDLNVIDQNDDVFPVITVTRPIANQVYVSGDSIVVEGKVTDDKKLYKGKVQIKNDAISLVVSDAYYETHFLSSINYRVAYKAVVTVPTDFTVLIEFQDHGLNTSTATTKVKVNP